MKPAHPREILRRATRKPDLFCGQFVVLRLTNGSHYQGKWQDCDGENFQLILRDDGTGALIWLDAHALESISFPHASNEMLSVLSGRTFDPYSNAEKLGDLAISRQIAVTNEVLNKLLGKQINLNAKSLADIQSPTASHVLIDMFRMTEKAFENLCTDDFAKTEIAKLVSEIKLTPEPNNCINLKDGVMTIEFTWEKPDQRWRESELTEAMNKKL